MIKRIATCGLSSLFILTGIVPIASAEQLTESSKPATYIIGKNCTTTTKFLPQPPKATPCRTVTVTGIDDLKSPLYFYFTDEFGTGMVFVTERLSNGILAKIKAVGNVADNKVTQLSKIDKSSTNSSTNNCMVNQGGFKVACLYESAGNILMGLLEDF
jgi:hypothetical protein